MSLAQQTSLIRLWFRDNDNTETSCQVQFATIHSGDVLLPLVSGWAALVSALSDAVLVRAELIMRWNENAPGSAAVPSNVRRSGTFTLETTATALSIVRVPSINEVYILSTGPYTGIGLDTSNADVTALISALTGGISAITPCDPFGADITALSNAFVELY